MIGLLLVYALYPQWDLYKQIFVAIIDVFSVSSLPKLVNACLDTISDISEEKLILVIEPEVREKENVNGRNCRNSFFAYLTDFNFLKSLKLDLSAKYVKTVLLYPNHFTSYNSLYIHSFITVQIITN